MQLGFDLRRPLCSSDYVWNTFGLNVNCPWLCLVMGLFLSLGKEVHPGPSLLPCSLSWKKEQPCAGSAISRWPTQQPLRFALLPASGLPFLTACLFLLPWGHCGRLGLLAAVFSPCRNEVTARAFLFCEVQIPGLTLLGGALSLRCPSHLWPRPR